MKRSMLVGIIAAAVAAFSLSLSFIVPFVIGAYSLFDFTLVEIIFSGILSAGLLCRNAPAVRQLKVNDWFAGCSLGLTGYVAYFLAVMAAAVYAGPVIAPGLQSKSLASGIPLALLAVIFWTSFGLLNQGALARRPDMDVGVWTALIMAGAAIFARGLMCTDDHHRRIFQATRSGAAACHRLRWAGCL